MEVEAILSEKPPQSTFTEISSLTNISRTSVFCLIHSELKLKSYKIQINQKLFEVDFHRCAQTVEDLLPLIQDMSLEYLIYFLCDKATFYISDYDHSQNCRIQSLEKPTITNQYEDNTVKVNFWFICRQTRPFAHIFSIKILFQKIMCTCCLFIFGQ